ncbi:Transaldolase A [Candidatus Rubidus massiliensis]|nr:Transaldolase A [Candidatus Rubidus massiliensis]
MSKLQELQKMTTIVIDTGDIEKIAQYHPVDATTNPSLILKASQNKAYDHLIEEAVNYAKKSNQANKKALLMDKLFVNFGKEILKHIPGRVSTEVNANLSFDVKASIEKAHSLIQLYEEEGIDRERILIKLASTWEGAQAAKELEKEGIHCNMTLLFSLPQAAICAESKATLISPFVGRILDWYKKNEGKDSYKPEEDPGVVSVKNIYTYFKKFGYKTQIMGASFRNAEEILELAGCDLLTISPELLEELSHMNGNVERKLDPAHLPHNDLNKIIYNESAFRLALNENQMATEKLSEGIRKFAEDANKLEEIISKKYSL